MYNKANRSLSALSNLGLLAIRLGVGSLFFLHYGWDKLQGGSALWEKLGAATGSLGIHGFPLIFGLAASCSECFGGLCLMLGLFTRPAAFFMLCTMIVALFFLRAQHKGLDDLAHPYVLACLFFGLIFIGPGRISIDAKLGTA